MRKMKQYAVVVISIICLQVKALAQVGGTGEIRGLVKDENHQTVIGTVITVTSGGVVAGKTVTGEDGKYVVKPLTPGYYDVLVQQSGYRTLSIKNVLVESEDPSYVDVDLELNTLETYTVVAEQEWKKPPLDKSVYTMHTINAAELNQMAVTRGDIVGIIQNISTDVKVDEGTGQIHSRGARAGTSQYFIDGEKVVDKPEFAALGIQSVSMLTGGIPAQYGDLTGGAVIIAGRDYFTGIAEKRMRENAYRKKQEQEASGKKEAEEKEKRKQEIEAEKRKVKEGNTE